ncbi:PIN domain-containing protein [Candidatus Hakubella thermalkaliphila]|uniref:PIN domain-containing protein n=2 Tax=Candidatus Hakubella thermalkaliphila TaxID=2754717 RepID=A0A6V8PCA4_9ACTN|nr:hypothetical protein [Candidatus Hakubella thermalkaliphila]GFP29877.1 hypothetical protein HKBW3S34_00797 [Candidatus Hakubella thermalkaliphila]GFP38979.1 hypothetical protein HKBW3S47_00679 [Candidatus Hakubella thermalkaliphila]
MPGYVLDTDTCIYWLKGDKKVEGKVLEAGLDDIIIIIALYYQSPFLSLVTTY